MKCRRFSIEHPRHLAADLAASEDNGVVVFINKINGRYPPGSDGLSV